MPRVRTGWLGDGFDTSGSGSSWVDGDGVTRLTAELRRPRRIGRGPLGGRQARSGRGYGRAWSGWASPVRTDRRHGSFVTHASPCTEGCLPADSAGGRRRVSAAARPRNPRPGQGLYRYRSCGATAVTWHSEPSCDLRRGTPCRDGDSLVRVLRRTPTASLPADRHGDRESPPADQVHSMGADQRRSGRPTGQGCPAGCPQESSCWPLRQQVGRRCPQGSGNKGAAGQWPLAGTGPACGVGERARSGLH